MFITKKHLSRRTVLRGVGASIGLPLLDAMIPAGTALAATAAKPTPYMACIYIPHGAVMADWTPRTTGTQFEMSPILKPLEPFRSHLTVVSGLRNKAGESPSPHSIIPGTWLTAVHPPVSEQPHVGPSVDQVAATVLSKSTPLISLELAGEGGGGACDPSSGCSYSATIAFRTGTQPLPMEQDPRTAFTRLFGEGDTAKERAAITQEDGSILDFVRTSARDLQRSLDPSDRRMVSDYLDSVREMEQRVQRMEAKFDSGSSIQLPDAPAGIPQEYDQMLDVMFDMILLAWQADVTHVATFMMAREVTMRTFPSLGITAAWHPLSHHHGDSVKLAQLTKIQNYMTKGFSRFVKKLSETKNGDGMLLDHSLILFGSNMSNSDLHNNDPLPGVLVGRCCGAVKGGQHLQYPQDTPHANLLLTMLHRSGIPAKSHGISTGELSEI